MSKRTYIGLSIGLVLGGTVLLWWVLSGPETEPPSRHPIEGLEDTVTVGWTDQHTAILKDARGAEAFTALGYVHGMTRAWTVTVWHRTALGKLSASWGEDLVPIDRHVRRLGFGHHARQTYDQLSPTTQRRLQAYTRGLNAALESERVRRRTPFVYLDLTPNRWKPWHPLAIERLLAWTGTDVSSLFGGIPTGPSNFERADRRLRRWLHLHGRARSMAWAARSRSDNTRPVLFARHVLGASAEPLIQEVMLRPTSGSPTVLASLPGVPLFPTGTTGSQSWSYLLSSRARLDRVAVDSTQLQVRHERIAPARGAEELVRIRRHGDALWVANAPPDSAWVLQWPGLQTHTDIGQWIPSLRGENAPRPDSGANAFSLFEGFGLALDATGNWSVRGQPPVVERGPGTILIGRSRWARSQATALEAQQARTSVRPSQWSASDSSTWAASLLPRMRPALDPLEGRAPVQDDALSYLGNWDFGYQPASIGAVVFERWMQTYRNEIGRVPADDDSVFFAAARQRQAFREAVNRLAAQYGTDVRQWRWERVAQTQRYFPVWSSDSLVAEDLSSLSTTRYAPLDRPGRGHPSALSGGPSLVDPPAMGPAPTQWDGWMRSGTANLTVRRLRLDPSGIFARSLLPRDAPSPVSVSDAPPTRTTRLVPAPSHDE